MMDSNQWQRYLDNRCTPEERKRIALWLERLDPAEWKTLMEEGWQSDAPLMPAEVDLRVRTSLAARMKETRPSIVYHIIRPISVAAACLALLAGGLGWWLHQGRQPAALPVVTYKDIRNASGSVEAATLPDGSLVWLMPRSTLRIGSDFNIKERSLQLSGEGYFEVAKDPGRPFSVTAGPLKTIVLGTHFDIASYPGESTTAVSLSEGSVAVKNGKDSIIRLSPGMRLCYRDAFVLGRLLPGEENLWKNGSMVLNDVSMRDAFHRIGSRFGKTILFPGAGMDNRRITAIYADPSLDVILRNLAYVQGFHYQEKGDTVFIQSR